MVYMVYNDENAIDPKTKSRDSLSSNTPPGGLQMTHVGPLKVPQASVDLQAASSATVATGMLQHHCRAPPNACQSTN